jgi:prolyl-tRNA synthetase
VNETKLLNAAKALTLEAATEDEIRSRVSAEPGYASPIGLSAQHAIGDESLHGMANFVTGANEAGYHVINANTPRDFAVSQIADIAEAYDGAECLQCGGILHIEHAIELGHCFKLGTRYSQWLDASYIDAKGDSQHIVMGSYGIGLDRLMAAIIETHHDEHGIVWPAIVAPFDVHLVAIAKTDAVTQAAETLYEQLQQTGMDVLYDDRNLSPGVMFADADLIGVPLRITVSPRSMESGGIEVKQRSEEERHILPLEKAVEQIADLLHLSR